MIIYAHSCKFAPFISVQIPIVPNGKYPHSKVVICQTLLDSALILATLQPPFHVYPVTQCTVIFSLQAKDKNRRGSGNLTTIFSARTLKLFIEKCMLFLSGMIKSDLHI